MGQYQTYFLMKEEDVAAYVKAKVDFFAQDETLEVKEIGDGNLNYVFRVKSVENGKTLIVKQAGITLRISDQLSLPVDRGRIEVDILNIEGEFAPGFVPEVYLYDEIMCAIIMEDMIHHTMMRTALVNKEIFPLFAEQISSFLVNTLLSTSDLAMNHKEKKELMKKFVNPELCDITEDFVFTAPYVDNSGANESFVDTLDFIATEIQGDAALMDAAAMAKMRFMNYTESLIHGDLHTGSIFINKEHLYVFDPEFACFGPAGYDIGNVVANMLFAWAGSDAAKDDPKAETFCEWALECIKDIVDLFISKYDTKYDEIAKDPMFQNNGFKEAYLKSLLEDTAIFAATEVIRRIIGLAKVKDITTIADAKERAKQEKRLLLFAKKMMLEKELFITGEVYISNLKNICVE